MPLTKEDSATFDQWVASISTMELLGSRLVKRFLETIKATSESLAEAQSAALIYVDPTIKSIMSPLDLVRYHGLSQGAMCALCRTDRFGHQRERWLFQVNGDRPSGVNWARYLNIPDEHLIIIPGIYEVAKSGRGDDAKQSLRASKSKLKDLAKNFKKLNPGQGFVNAWNLVREASEGRVVLTLYGHGRMYEMPGGDEEYSVGLQTATSLIESISGTLAEEFPALSEILTSTRHVSVLSCESRHFARAFMTAQPHIPTATFMNMCFDPSDRRDAKSAKAFHYFAHPDGDKGKRYPLLPYLGVMYRDNDDLLVQPIDLEHIAAQVERILQSVPKLKGFVDLIGDYLREV